ncbi:unnamed protein product, partial [Ixodes hexagonus]
MVYIVDWKKYDNLIRSYRWGDILSSSNVSNLYTKFRETLNSLRGKYIREVRMRKRKPDQPWVDARILAEIKHKELARAHSRRNPGNEQLKQDFRITRNRVNAMLRSAKRRHYKNKLYESSRDLAK